MKKSTLEKLKQMRESLRMDIPKLERERDFHANEYDRIDKELDEIKLILGNSDSHDCSQGGTRRVYKRPNALPAIFELLPENEPCGLAEIVDAINADRFTYAYSTIACNLSKATSYGKMNIIHTDATGKQWGIQTEGGKGTGSNQLYTKVRVK